MKKGFAILILGLLLVAGACKKASPGTSEEQAIKQTLETYLTTKKSLNLKGMKVDYKNFQIAQDHATVDVMFSGGSSHDMTIGFKYALKKNAGGWEVEKGEATSGSMFGGHAGGPPATGEAPMPAGHPMVAPSAGAQPGGMEAAHGTEPKKK